MGLFDVIDDIAERQIIKTDTGDNRIFGVVIGRVTKNYSDSMPGRVCVSIQTRDAEANVLKWARVAMPYAGDSWGIYFLPEVGDQVLLAFEQGNIERPYVIGCVGQKADDFLKKSKDEHNKNKRIVSKHGNTFQILDAEQGEGTEDKIEIFTADEAHSVTIDNSFYLTTVEHRMDAEGNYTTHLTGKAAKLKYPPGRGHGVDHDERQQRDDHRELQDLHGVRHGEGVDRGPGGPGDPDGEGDDGGVDGVAEPEGQRHDEDRRQAGQGGLMR